MLRHFTLPGSDAGSEREAIAHVQGGSQVGRVGRVDGDEDVVGSEDPDGRVSPKDKDDSACKDAGENNQTSHTDDVGTSEDHGASQTDENDSTADRGDERPGQEVANGTVECRGEGSFFSPQRKSWRRV
ncbi:hypothetical protein BU24DRAFT_421230 [Aaosphaeria arxii CBS 175.79]|uniref:Uncharacterized protein n=1 Tax=Aaosphaeria arxii CBS 175.79 TaxID=1450172 RepID=A0A6A5XZH8_9PLEO|nr:uncharacterized protein BU24DRAFT_421230 [Aaosphaeria arxii CBS 175.79]KAF2018217.1 hypothetical protein BU24DRAFT_421230 [Aaosphaeria arxii CBS 175.79]